MKAPGFWWQDGWPARLLSPLSAIGTAITHRRMAQPGWQMPIPVICCGGVTVGGAGKTTVALAIGATLVAAGMQVHFLTRGHGGRLRGPVRVDPARHTAEQVGDEALLLAAIAPCWVARDRAAGARQALGQRAEAIVMDDGLQNPGLHKTLSLLVVDGATGFGNARVLPAGPLREPVAMAAARSQAAVLIGDDQCDALARLPSDLPVLRAVLRPNATGLRGCRVFAMAGIAFPGKFHASLQQAGAVLVGQADFPDHHRFTARQLDRALAAAAALGACAVTTPKDAVRLPPAYRDRFQVAGIDLVWANPAALQAILARAVP